jgi:hypothetical protein
LSSLQFTKDWYLCQENNLSPYFAFIKISIATIPNPGHAGGVAGGCGLVPGAVPLIVLGVVHAWLDTVTYRFPAHPAGKISALAIA